MVLCLLGNTLLAQTPTVYRGKEEQLPQPVAPQPVAFSHALHTKAGLSCRDCHENVAKAERAGLPAAEKCMICHGTIATDRPEIEKLAAFHDENREISWVRVYEVPDFVFFSHASHVGKGIECAECHGPVERRDVLSKEVSTSMIACMNCHEQRGASTECFLCHDLGQ